MYSLTRLSGPMKEYAGMVGSLPLLSVLFTDFILHEIVSFNMQISWYSNKGMSVAKSNTCMHFFTWTKENNNHTMKTGCSGYFLVYMYHKNKT